MPRFQSLKQLIEGSESLKEGLPSAAPTPPENDPLRQQFAKDKLYQEGYKEGSDLGLFFEPDDIKLRPREELEQMDPLNDDSIMDEYVKEHDPKQWGKLNAIHNLIERTDPLNNISVSPMKMPVRRFADEILPAKRAFSKIQKALPSPEINTELPSPVSKLELPAPEQKLSLPAPKIETSISKKALSSKQIPNRFVVPGLYSEVESTIANKMGDFATPKQVIELLSKAKPTELKFLQIPEFLSDKNKVSKQELMDHIQDRLDQFSTENFSKAFKDEIVNLPKDYKMEGFSFDPIYGNKSVQSYVDSLNKEYSDVITGLESSIKNPKLSTYDKELLNKELNDPNFKNKLVEKILLKAQDSNNLNFPELLLVGDPSLKNPIRASRKIFEHDHHGKVPNIIGHTRRNIIEDPERGKLYQLEEAQSDFHQQGSRHGYRKLPEIGSKEFLEELNAPEEIKNLKVLEEQLQEDMHRIVKKMNDFGDLPKLYEARKKAHLLGSPQSEIDKIQEQIINIHNSDAYNKLDKQVESLDKQQQELRNKRYKLQKHLNSLKDKVSDEVPFRGEKISEVLFKKALYDAAKNQADEFQWTTPRTQVERYTSVFNPSKLASIDVVKNANGTYNIQGMDKDDKFFNFDNIKEEHLRSILPEPLLKKVKSETPEVVGGEPVWSFEAPNYVYAADKSIVPNPTMYLGGGKFREIYGKTGPEFIKKFAKEYDAEPQIIEDLLDPTKFSSLKLTPEMRENILKKGFPLFLLPLLMQNVEQEPENNKTSNRFEKTKNQIKNELNN